MLRRDFLRLTAVGVCSAAGLAHAGNGGKLRGIAIAHARVAAGPDVLRIEVSARALRDADVDRRKVDAADYFGQFGLRPRDAGVSAPQLTILATPFADAMAEIIEADRKLFVIWDGVLYRIEVTP